MLKQPHRGDQVIGNGSFGVVYQAKLCETNEMVAIKKVLQERSEINNLFIITFQIVRSLDLGSDTLLEYTGPIWNNFIPFPCTFLCID